MKTNLNNIIDEAEKLELNVAELYTVFAKAFPGDFDFWYKLVEEEHNHAALLHGLKEVAPVIGGSVPDIVPQSLDSLLATNKKLRAVISRFKSHPERKAAFKLALEIENSAGEIHFQKFMEMRSVSGDYEVFQNLNREDKDHAKRIKKYMEDHNI